MIPRTLKEIKVFSACDYRELHLENTTGSILDHQCVPGRRVSTGNGHVKGEERPLEGRQMGDAGSLPGSIRETCGKVLQVRVGLRDRMSVTKQE